MMKRVLTAVGVVLGSLGLVLVGAQQAQASKESRESNEGSNEVTPARVSTAVGLSGAFGLGTGNEWWSYDYGWGSDLHLPGVKVPGPRCSVC